MRVLLVEDDHAIVRALTDLLEGEGFAVRSCATQDGACAALATDDFDIALLDVTLAQGNGFAVCAAAREAAPDMPVIFLTASDDEYSTVAGLDMGAVDYIAKPFSIREVLARVRSVLRRTAQPAAEEKAVAFEGLRMDLTRKVCTIDGEPLALTKKEFEILALLLSSRGKIFSREEILRQVWSDEVIVLDRTIDVNITRLRRKIGPYGEHIVTRLGYGYGFEE